MLRTLALMLLLGNALLLAALTGLFDGAGALGEREPARLQSQQQPALVRILGPQAASAALAAASAQAAAASSAQALACLEAGPFSAADAAAAERTLSEAGLAPGAWQAQRQDDSGAFMVYMGRYADRETLQRKLGELKRLKLDGEDLRGVPELQPGIGLGRFDSQASADTALAQLAQRGLRSARVITLRQAQSQTVLRIPAADAPIRARLAGLQMPSGPGFVLCAAGAVAPAASAAPQPAAAASAAASASALPAVAPAPAVTKPDTAAAPRPAPAAASTPAPAPARAAANPAAGAATRAALARASSAAASAAGISASR